MSNIVLLETGPKPCEDLSEVLRELADKVDKGEIVDMVMCYIEGNEYKAHRATSLEQALVLSQLLNTRIIDGFRD